MSAFDHKKALADIPHKPGVYQYWDAEGTLIYIGKAKDLRNRVGSYFIQDNQLNGKNKGFGLQDQKNHLYYCRHRD